MCFYYCRRLYVSWNKASSIDSENWCCKYAELLETLYSATLGGRSYSNPHNYLGKMSNGDSRVQVDRIGTLVSIQPCPRL